MDPSKLSPLLDLLQAKGVLYYKNADLEIQMGPKIPDSFQPFAEEDEEEEGSWRGLSAEDRALLGVE